MPHRKQVCLVLLLILLMALLCGCQQESSADIPESTVASEPETLPETEPETVPTEPVWSGYTGPKDTYINYYAEGRDADWEKDILYFANSHMSDNQLLRNRQFVVNLPGGKTDAACFYNAELYDNFLASVNDLIPEIKNLSDNEILYRIQMMSALFRDVHTSAYPDSEAFYPILFMPIRENGEFVYYAVVMPIKNEELLYTRLTAINGLPIQEVVERIRSYASYENEYGFIDSLGKGGYSRDLLSSAAALEATGISKVGDTAAVFTLADSEGKEHQLKLETTEQFDFSQCCGKTPSMAFPVPYWYGSEENYWYTTDLAESTIYVRISSFNYEEEESYLDFSGALTLESNTTGHFRKVIVDLRDNSGGHSAEGWRAIINALCRMDFDEFYILVDGGTYSCSMLFASEVKNQIPETIFVGSPTGEAPGFFAGIYAEDYILPNCGIEFTVPTQYYQTFEANEDNALVPDVVIWATIDEYINSYDAVLTYVLEH